MFTMSISEITQMTTKERLQTMELLWDSISHDKTEVESPNWHNEVLVDRKKILESGNTNFDTIEELKNRFQK